MPDPTREEAERWVMAHSHEIAVRAFIDGKWDSYFLDEIPPELRPIYVNKMVERRLAGLPVHLVRTDGND